MPKKSDVPRQLLEYLSARPARKSPEIAKDLDLPLQTVQRHLRALETTGVIREGYVLTGPTAKPPNRFHIYASVEYGELKGVFRPSAGVDPQSSLVRQIRKEIEENAFVKGRILLESIDILLGGDYDLVIIVYAEDIQTVGNFVVFVLRDIVGVRWTRTATVWHPEAKGT